MNDDLNIVAPDLTVIIPTRNERANVEPLLERLTAALGATPAEILFVDDSDDDTADEIIRVGRTLHTAVRLLYRSPDQREGGLSTAVVSGLRAARAPWALVMDADLQHPPETVPELFATARRRPVDLVVASRYAGHGCSDGLDGGTRRNSSRFATRVAKAAFPRRAARVSDPMSGFFAVRLAALDVDRLRPYGYKILLELIVRNPNLRTAEVSFRFAPRHAGESKTSVREVLRFGRHLARLRLQIARERNDAARQAPRALRRHAWRSGWSACPASWSTPRPCGCCTCTSSQLHYLVAAALATQVSTLWNFVLDRPRWSSARAHADGRLEPAVAVLPAEQPRAAAATAAAGGPGRTSGLGVLAANVVTLVAAVRACAS